MTDNTPYKISVVINTYNAEQYLEKVLQAVKDFDQILICDMESTDSTLAIAQKYGCDTVTFPRKKYNIVEHARNFALYNARYKYVLVVDADEIVTKELKDYLYRIVKTDCPDGLFIRRKNKFMGKYIEESVDDWQLRFFNKEKTFWPEVIHSIPQVKGRTEKIPLTVDNAIFLHLAEEYLHDRLEKLNRYTDNEVEKKQDRNFGAWALFYRPFWYFFRSYILQKGFMHGIRGFIKAHMEAQYQYFTVAKILEKKLK
ncbi:MAG: glycosyltransferase family 2 protein [Bacteroidales bacterium]|nr:glycosyltransferase family 2 protein [Bacteroidales bacterium]